MRKDRRRITTTLLAIALVALVVLVMAGCGKYTSGETFNQKEGDQATPEAAVQKWLGSMEWNKTGRSPRPREGRDFQAYVDVSSTVLFPDGMVPDTPDWDALAADWNSKSWEIEFLDLQFQTVSNDGSTAVIDIIGGQTRYIGKEMFGTTEYKVDDFRDKEGRDHPGEGADGKWRVMKAQVLNHDESWES